MEQRLSPSECASVQRGDVPPLLHQASAQVATEMALSVLAYNLTRVLNIIGIKPLIAAMGA
jgi:hypothetical protein